MPNSRSNVFHFAIRSFLAFSIILLFGALSSQAASGVLRITVKDVDTHYSLQAKLTLQDSQTLSVQTNDAGRVTVTLAPGDYRIEVSAPSHKTTRTHYNIGQGTNPPFTIFLEPENVPAEELPENISADLRPGFTLLHGYTVDADSGKPISGVKVRLNHSNVETRTDSKGHYVLSAPTPVSEYPGGLGTDTLVFEKSGYSTEIFENFGIAGEAMGGTGLEMEKGSQIHKHDATHKLSRNEISGPEEPQSARPALKTPRDLLNWLSATGVPFSVGVQANASVATSIAIPSSIRVGTGGSSTRSYQPCATPTTCTNVFSYPLESYVNQGLLGEWVAGWVLDSFKAGAVAYRSYGANFVQFPVDPKGTYDICNTPVCQVYNPWDHPPTTNTRTL